jgi:hypothetical protein
MNPWADLDWMLLGQEGVAPPDRMKPRSIILRSSQSFHQAYVDVIPDKCHTYMYTSVYQIISTTWREKFD